MTKTYDIRLLPILFSGFFCLAFPLIPQSYAQGENTPETFSIAAYDFHIFELPPYETEYFETYGEIFMINAQEVRFDDYSDVFPRTKLEASMHNTVGFGIMANLKWHLIRNQKWDLFANTGFGGMHLQRTPLNTEREFNLHYQIGCGIAWKMSEDTHLTFDARHYAIKGSDIFNNSTYPSYNSNGGFVGLEIKY